MYFTTFIVCSLLFIQVTLSVRLSSFILRSKNRKTPGFEITKPTWSDQSKTGKNTAHMKKNEPNPSVTPTPSTKLSIHASEKSIPLQPDPWADDNYWMDDYHHVSEPSPTSYPDPFMHRHSRRRTIRHNNNKAFVPETYPACGKHGERVDLPASMSSKLFSFDDDTFPSEYTVGTEMVEACRMAMTYMEYRQMHRRPTCSAKWKITLINDDYICVRMSPRCMKLERDMRRKKMLSDFNIGDEDYLAFKISCLQEPNCGRNGVAQAGQCYERCTNGLERNGPACVRYMYYEPYCERKDLIEGGEMCRFPGTSTYIQTLKTLGAHQSMYGRFGPLYRKYGYNPM